MLTRVESIDPDGGRFRLGEIIAAVQHGPADNGSAPAVLEGAVFVESEPWKELSLGSLKLVGRLDRVDATGDGRAFVMYGRKNRSMIALFDPIGPRDAWPELVPSRWAAPAKLHQAHSTATGAEVSAPSARVTVAKKT